MHDSLFVNLPGSYNSSHRFARAAKLPTVGYIWEWPKYIETSLLYAVAGQPSTNPTLMAVMDVFNGIHLPKGMDDAGGEQSPTGTKNRDITWFFYIA
jgi:pSer/pThr/pTyr-binding forkhead associated (FHA) protein